MACSKVYTVGTIASSLVLVALTGAYILSYWYVGPLCSSDGSACVPVHAGIFVSCAASPAGFGPDCTPVESTSLLRNRRVETIVVRVTGGVSCLASILPVLMHATLACAKLRGGRRSVVQKQTKWRMRVISWAAAATVLVCGAVTVAVMAEVLPPGGEHVGWCFWLVAAAWGATALSAALIDRKMTMSAVKDAAAMMNFTTTGGVYPDLMHGTGAAAHGYDMRALDDDRYGGGAAPREGEQYRGVRGASYASDTELGVTSLPSTPPDAAQAGTGVHSDDDDCVGTSLSLMPALGEAGASPSNDVRVHGHRVDSPPHGADAHLLPATKRPQEVPVSPSPRVPPRSIPQQPSPIASGSMLPGASSVPPSPMPAPPITAARRGASLGSPAGGRTTTSRRSSGHADSMHQRTESTSSDVEVDVDFDLSVSLSDAEAFALGRGGVHSTSARRIHASPAAAGTGARGDGVDVTAAPRSPPGRALPPPPGPMQPFAVTSAATSATASVPSTRAGAAPAAPAAVVKPAVPPPNLVMDDGPITAARASSASNMFATTRQQRSTTQDALTLSGSISIDASPVDARPLPASLSLVAGLATSTDSLGRLLGPSPVGTAPDSSRGPPSHTSSVRAGGVSRRSLLGMPSVFDSTRRLSGVHGAAADVGAAKDGIKRSSLRDAIRSATMVQEVVDDEF